MVGGANCITAGAWLLTTARTWTVPSLCKPTLPVTPPPRRSLFSLNILKQNLPFNYFISYPVWFFITILTQYMSTKACYCPLEVLIGKLLKRYIYIYILNGHPSPIFAVQVYIHNLQLTFFIIQQHSVHLFLWSLQWPLRMLDGEWLIFYCTKRPFILPRLYILYSAHRDPMSYNISTLVIKKTYIGRYTL